MFCLCFAVAKSLSKLTKRAEELSVVYDFSGFSQWLVKPKCFVWNIMMAKVQSRRNSSSNDNQGQRKGGKDGRGKRRKKEGTKRRKEGERKEEEVGRREETWMERGGGGEQECWGLCFGGLLPLPGLPKFPQPPKLIPSSEGQAFNTWAHKRYFLFKCNSY